MCRRVTAFQKLYVSRRIAPKAVAIIQPGIQPGHGFGLNWTDFTNPSGIFAKVVEGNAAGLPKLLLFGGHARRNIYRSPCWPDYRNCLGFFSKAGGGSIGILEWKTRRGRC
jgi:hypothetical protein